MEKVLREGQFRTLGFAGRAVGLSGERLRQLARAGRLSVVHDSCGRVYIDDLELSRFVRERAQKERPA